MSVYAVSLIARRLLSGSAARSGLTSRGRARLVGSILGVALSLIPLVVVQQVAEGMIAGIAERFIELGSYHIQAAALPGGTGAVVDQERIDRIRRIDGVVSAQPEIQGFGLLYGEGGRTGIALRAVEGRWWHEDAAVRRLLALESGAFDLESERAIVLGVAAAEQLGVDVGDDVRLLTARTTSAATLPRVSRFRVTGIVSTGYRDLDRAWAFIPLERGMRVIPADSARRLVGIKVEHPHLLPNPLFGRGLRRLGTESDRLRMLEVLGEIERRFEGEAWVSTWYEAEEGRYRTFVTSRNLLALVMALIVVVAAVNISSSLALLVAEHREDFAILRATGARPRTLVAALLVAGVLIGSAGALVGALIGLLIALHINWVLRAIEGVLGLFAGRAVEIFSPEFYLEEIPVTVELAPLIGAVVLALAVSLLAALLPAMRAARVRPEQILRRH